MTAPREMMISGSTTFSSPTRPHRSKYDAMCKFPSMARTSKIPETKRGGSRQPSTFSNRLSLGIGQLLLAQKRRFRPIDFARQHGDISHKRKHEPAFTLRIGLPVRGSLCGQSTPTQRDTVGKRLLGLEKYPLRRVVRLLQCAISCPS